MLSITPIKNLLFQLEKKLVMFYTFFYIYKYIKKHNPLFHIVLYEVKMAYMKPSTMTIVKVHNVV